MSLVENNKLINKCEQSLSAIMNYILSRYLNFFWMENRLKAKQLTEIHDFLFRIFVINGDSHQRSITQSYALKINDNIIIMIYSSLFMQRMQRGP